MPKHVINVYCKQANFIDVRQSQKHTLRFQSFGVRFAEFEVNYLHGDYPSPTALPIPGFPSQSYEASAVDVVVPFNSITDIYFDKHNRTEPFYFVDQKHLESVVEVIFHGRDISKQEGRYTRNEDKLSREDRIVFAATEKDYYIYLDHLAARADLVCSQVQQLQLILELKTAADQALLAKAEAERAFEKATDTYNAASRKLRDQENHNNFITSSIKGFDQDLASLSFAAPVAEKIVRPPSVIFMDDAPSFLKKGKSKVCSIM